MENIWIIILIFEGSIGFFISKFITHRAYFAFFWVNTNFFRHIWNNEKKFLNRT